MTEDQPTRSADGATPGREDRAAPGVVLDLTRHAVHVDGSVVPFTYRELELLRRIVARAGRTTPRSALLEATTDDAASARSVDAAIRRVRLKLGPYRDVIRSVRGAGYRFDPHPDVRVIE